MNPLSVISSIFGVGAVGAGSVFGYLFLTNNQKKESINNTNNISSPPPIVIPENLKYTSFKHIPKEDQKYFPFSNKEQPEKYDSYFLIKKTKSVGEISGTVKWGNIESSIIDNNNNGDFTCSINAGGDAVYWNNNGSAPICQLFEIINADENNKNADWKKCPNKIEELKPISFKGKTEDSFPTVFLYAFKYNKNEMIGKNHSNSEIYVGNSGNESQKLMHIYTNNAQSSDWIKCSNIN